MARAIHDICHSEITGSKVDRIVVVGFDDVEMERIALLHELFGMGDLKGCDRIVFEFPYGQLNDYQDKMQAMDDLFDAYRRWMADDLIDHLKAGYTDGQLVPVDNAGKAAVLAFFTGFVHSGDKILKDDYRGYRRDWDNPQHRYLNMEMFFELKELQKLFWYDRGIFVRKLLGSGDRYIVGDDHKRLKQSILRLGGFHG